MKATFTFVSIFVVTALYSQEKYQVLYDFSTDKVNYLKLDKHGKVIDTLSKGKFKKSTPVEIKLKNVNPFAVEVVSQITEEEIHEQTDNSFNFTSLLGGISKFSGNKTPINIENLPVDEKSFSRGDSRGSARGSVESYNKMTANIDAVKSTLLSNLLNPNMTKEQILSNLKKVSTEIITGKFSSDPNDNYYLFLTELERIINEDTQDIADYVSLLSSDFSKNNSTTVMDFSTRGAEYSKFSTTADNLSKSNAQNTENIKEIKELYSKLEGSTFEKVYDYNVKSDKANVNLKFIESAFANSYDDDSEKTTVKERQIKLYSRGGFKINTSVAMTLNNFGTKSKNYYISEEGVIGADANDNFVPNLSTMINFYPVLSESVNIGGSFGLSIPISDNIRGVNFLIGPSLFFGSKSRMSVSGGLAYGPVQRLINGLELGEETTLKDISNYTRNVYDLGYYFGISFSIANLK